MSHGFLKQNIRSLRRAFAAALTSVVLVTGSPAPAAANSNEKENQSSTDLQNATDSPLYLDLMNLGLMRDYRKAILSRQEKEVISLEQEIQRRNLASKEAQYIRNNAMLYAAKTFPSDNIMLSLKYGADIHARNEDGENIGELIIAKGALHFGVLALLHQKYQYDTNFLDENNSLIWAAFAKLNLPDDEKFAIDAVKFLQQTGYDTSNIRETSTGLSLADLARQSKSENLLTHLAESKVEYQPHHKKWDYNTYRQYFKNVDANTFNIPHSSYHPKDFKNYKEIIHNKKMIPENGIEPVLLVTEFGATLGAVSHDLEGGLHIFHTGRTAYGATMALDSGAGRSNGVFAVQYSLAEFNKTNELTSLLNANQGNYIVVSVSTTTTPLKNAEAEYRQTTSSYRKVMTFRNKEIQHADQKEIVLYNVAGNERLTSCIERDGISFCLQSHEEEYHHRNLVRVGAIHQGEDTSPVSEWYSNDRPAFCAPLPEHNGNVIHGTSFTTPSAAAVDKRLAKIFARSSRLPDGMTNKDIMMALMLTAKTEGLIENTPNSPLEKTVPVTRNSAGIKMTDRCGAGVIDGNDAKALLTKMFQWTQENPDIVPTEVEITSFKTAAAHYKKQQDLHVYTMTVPKDGIITNLRAGIAFAPDNKGAAILQIGGSDPLALDLSKSGLTTDYRHVGHEIKKGDKVTLITTRPLVDTKDSQTFVDFITVNTDSPIKKAIEYTIDNYSKPQI